MHRSSSRAIRAGPSGRRISPLDGAPVGLTAADGFVLYSIGGDQVNDGGRVQQLKAWSGTPGDDEWDKRRGDCIYWPPIKRP